LGRGRLRRDHTERDHQEDRQDIEPAAHLDRSRHRSWFLSQISE
jgi:hypothetical protein